MSTEIASKFLYYSNRWTWITIHLPNRGRIRDRFPFCYSSLTHRVKDYNSIRYEVYLPIVAQKMSHFVPSNNRQFFQHVVGLQWQMRQKSSAKIRAIFMEKAQLNIVHTTSCRNSTRTIGAILFFGYIQKFFFNKL